MIGKFKDIWEVVVIVSLDVVLKFVLMVVWILLYDVFKGDCGDVDDCGLVLVGLGGVFVCGVG